MATVWKFLLAFIFIAMLLIIIGFNYLQSEKEELGGNYTQPAFVFPGTKFTRYLDSEVGSQTFFARAKAIGDVNGEPAWCSVVCIQPKQREIVPCLFVYDAEPLLGSRIGPNRAVYTDPVSPKVIVYVKNDKMLEGKKVSLYIYSAQDSLLILNQQVSIVPDIFKFRLFRVMESDIGLLASLVALGVMFIIGMYFASPYL